MQDGGTARDAIDRIIEPSACEHLLQLYEHDGVLLDSLERFVAGGLCGGEAVVVIATPEHIGALRERLVARGIDVIAAENQDRYIALTALESLSEFMSDGMPDENLFRGFLARVRRRACAGGRSVRAFGEMVALLWARGEGAATVRLEQLWEQVRREQGFSVFCAYPQAAFGDDAAPSLEHICAAHSRLVAGPAEACSA